MNTNQRRILIAVIALFSGMLALGPKCVLIAAAEKEGSCLDY